MLMDFKSLEGINYVWFIFIYFLVFSLGVRIEWGFN